MHLDALHKVLYQKPDQCDCTKGGHDCMTSPTDYPIAPCSLMAESALSYETSSVRSTSPTLRASIIEEVSTAACFYRIFTCNVQKFIVRVGGGDRCSLGRVALMLHLSVRLRVNINKRS